MRFHITILQELYQVTFHKKLYGEPDTLKSDLNDWLAHLIISELIRGKCALAGRLWKYYLMENASGLRRIQSKYTLIDTCINNG